jgi:hypothetical protein
MGLSRFVTVRRAERIEWFGRDGRIASRQPMFNNDAVGTIGGLAVSTASSHQSLIATRASRDKKRRFAALAASRGMTESHLLMLLVDTVLQHNPELLDEGSRVHGVSKNRVTLRLRPGDLRKVAARAAVRGMKPASYMVALIHAHVGAQAPLPPGELNALKAAVNQLASVGRQLQQMALGGAAADHDARLRSTLHDTLLQVQALRQHTAEIVRNNLLSWEAGDA